jgi:hypothetical protein
MNTDFIFEGLGKTFFIKSNYSMPADPGTKWDRFIQFLNYVTPDGSFSGDSYGDCYGVIDGVGVIQGANAEIVFANTISLEQFIDVLDASTYAAAAEEFLEAQTLEEGLPVRVFLCGDLYDDETELIENCVTVTNDNSAYLGQWIRISDAVEIHRRYGGGYAHEDEVSHTISDDAFVTDAHDDIVWSSHNEGYIDTNYHNARFGYINRRDREWFVDDDYVRCEYNDTYYANADVANDHNVYWCERRDRYVHDDEVEPNNASYHDLRRHNLSRDEDMFLVGFEIEKEDDDACQIEYYDLYQDTKWIKESDSSLDSDNGYELVSPTYGLYDKQFDAAIQESRLVTLINAEYSTNCGGHINLSSKKYTPEQLAEGLSGFFPMLYALYNGRLNQNYCRAKKKHEYYKQDKYSAIYIKGHLVEFRIFSAVRNVTNLLWRRDLIRLMVENINKSETEVLKMMLNKSSKLHKHLAKVYSPSDMMTKAKLFIQYSAEFNNKKIDPPSNELGA